MENKLSKLGKLFVSMFYISSFTFGGGFVIITFMKKKFVDELGWIDEKEMLDYTAIAQSMPGVIAVNTSILVGWKIGGFLGMLVSVLGTILPPMIIISLISVAYEAFSTNEYVKLMLNGMQAGVAAVILDVVYTLGKHVVKTQSYVNMAVMVAAFIATVFFDVNIIYVILAAALVGIVNVMFLEKGEK